LDGFDQQLYSYVVPTVIAVWGMSTGAAAPGDTRPRHREPRARSARRGGVSSPDGHRAQL